MISSLHFICLEELCYKYCFSLVFACTFCYSFSFTDVKPVLMPFVPVHRIVGSAACESVPLNSCLKDLLFL